jgi:hypothetical protein
MGVDPSDLLPGPFGGERADRPSEAPVTSPMAGFGAPEYGPTGYPAGPPAPSGPPAPDPNGQAAAPTYPPSFAPPAGPSPTPTYPPPAATPAGPALTPPLGPPVFRPPGPPTPPRRTGLLVAAIAGATVLIMLVCGGAGLALRAQREPTGTARPSATAAPTESVPGPTGPSPTGPSPRPSPQSSATPTLKSAVSPATVVGPTFRAGEATYTMAFPGWPFAFRVPKTWGCLKGNFEGLPDALAWVCVDEGNAGARQKANVLLRRCPTTCTGPEQTVMDKVWFDKPEQAVRADATTRYVETARNTEGLYTVDMSHFFAPGPGRPPQWQVGVFVQSPPGTKAAVQKIVNDVRAQTP